MPARRRVGSWQGQLGNLSYAHYGQLSQHLIRFFPAPISLVITSLQTVTALVNFSLVQHSAHYQPSAAEVTQACTTRCYRSVQRPKRPLEPSQAAGSRPFEQRRRREKTQDGGHQ